MGLLRFFVRKKKPPEDTDTWKLGPTYYVVHARPQIEELAKNLARTSSPLFTRFNSEKGCAEIYYDCGIVFFQIRIHGEFGSPHTAIITSCHSALSEDVKKEIISTFPKLRVEFKNL